MASISYVWSSLGSCAIGDHGYGAKRLFDYIDRSSATMFHANGCVSSDLVENERTESQTRRNASIDLIDLRCD